jgi:hypothetical protein
LCSKKNINTGVDFNFRAGAKYFLPVNYEINATADYANGTYYPDVNLTILIYQIWFWSTK